MIKQYTEHKGAWWYNLITLYENGKQVHQEKVALTDLDNYIIKVENSGYEKAYTSEQIDSIRQQIIDLQERLDYMQQHRFIGDI